MLESDSWPVWWTRVHPCKRLAVYLDHERATLFQGAQACACTALTRMCEVRHCVLAPLPCVPHDRIPALDMGTHHVVPDRIYIALRRRPVRTAVDRRAFVHRFRHLRRVADEVIGLRTTCADLRSEVRGSWLSGSTRRSLCHILGKPSEMSTLCWSGVNMLGGLALCDQCSLQNTSLMTQIHIAGATDNAGSQECDPD